MKVHAPPNIGAELQKVFDSGFLTEGEYSDQFELEIGKYINNSDVCLVNSCTSALDLAAHMCRLEKGDEVITTAMTCFATNAPFYNRGAHLVFSNIEKETGNIDIEDVASKITPKTKAIVCVDWAGQPCDLQELRDLCDEHGIKLIEDAAHSFGATYQKNKIGSLADFTCFSFQAVKLLTTADGGAIACRSQEDAEKIRKLRWFGLDRKNKGIHRWKQDIPEAGFKYHMNNLNAAIGLQQLPHIDRIISQHQENAEYFDSRIENDKRASKLIQKPDRKSSCWLYTLLVSNTGLFIDHMAKAGIQTDFVHIPNDRYSVFKNLPTANKSENVHCWRRHMINIPVGWWLTEEDKDLIVKKVQEYQSLSLSELTGLNI